MIKQLIISMILFLTPTTRKRKPLTEQERLCEVWRQLRDYGSMRGFEMDYKFLRSCAHYVGVA